MNAEAHARITRLKRWIKANRATELCDDAGEPSAPLIAKKYPDGLKANQWSDILAERKDSFGAKAARKVEQILGIPDLHLEGGGWPFETVSFEVWSKLSERHKGQVEQAMIDRIKEIEASRSVVNGNDPSP